MPLTTLQVQRAKAGRHADANGLYLLVKPTGARSWLLRVQQDGKRQDIGLGAVDFAARKPDDPTNDIPLLSRRVLTLGEAREKAALLRKYAKAGHDPIAERDKARGRAPTFKEATIACHGEMKAGWTPKYGAAFLSTLEDHAFPTLGATRVDAIEAANIRDMLAPIWTEKPEMAKRVRQRVGTVLNFAKVAGWRATEAPGRYVTQGLARHGRGGSFAAMPYADVPAFVSDQMAKGEATGRNALLFAIFTAARSGEVRSARWEHIDLERGLWSRPANLMKSREAHSVTLNRPALDLLRRLDAERLIKVDGLIFSGKGGKMLSDMTLSQILRKALIPYTPHGFRSSFRDWAAEQMPSIPDPVAEAALAHAVPDKVVAAYKRTNFLEMRRKLLDAWGGYVSGTGNVVQLAVAS